MAPFTQHPDKIQLAAICTRTPNNALIAAECASLTGGAPDTDGFALCQQVEYIPQSAYIRVGLQILAQGTTLDKLVEAVAQANFAADEFKIEFYSLSKDSHISRQAAISALADAIPFYPNLTHPKHRFLLVERENSLWFGEILNECQHTYKIHAAKPHNISSSLPGRISRALVNLVFPQAQSLLDPCCGTGSILLEAQSLGLRVHGGDQNPRMVVMARQNLAHFGYDARVEHADARNCQQTADALVTNLPYGRLLEADEMLIRGILARGIKLAPLAVYVSEYKMSAWLADAGYRDIQVYPVSKHDGFVRYIYRACADE